MLIQAVAFVDIVGMGDSQECLAAIPSVSERQQATGIAAPKVRRLRTLDGLRGISVLLVIGMHLLAVSNFSVMSGISRAWSTVFISGMVGVRTFFVISGFIITSVLLKEYLHTGTISYLNFYKRRFVRLIPALYTFLIITMGLQFFIAHGGQVLPQCVVSSMTLTVGLFLNCPLSFVHQWSLTVEELFYLGWPLMVMLFARRSMLIPAISLMMICSGMRALNHILLSKHMQTSTGVIDIWLLQYLDQLAVGSMLGFAYVKNETSFVRMFSARPFLVRLIGFSLVFGIQILSQLGKFGIVVVPLGPLIQAAGIALLIGSLLAVPRGVCHRMLNFRPLVYVGTISYSAYLYQQVFVVPAESAGIFMQVLTSFPYCIFIIFALASMSFHFVEQPLQRLASRVGFQRKWTSDSYDCDVQNGKLFMRLALSKQPNDHPLVALQGRGGIQLSNNRP